MTFLKMNRVCVCECVPLRWTPEHYNIEVWIWAENTEFMDVFRFLWQVLPKDQGSNFPPNKLIILHRVRTYSTTLFEHSAYFPAQWRRLSLCPQVQTY